MNNKCSFCDGESKYFVVKSNEGVISEFRFCESHSGGFDLLHKKDTKELTNNICSDSLNMDKKGLLKLLKVALEDKDDFLVTRILKKLEELD